VADTVDDAMAGPEMSPRRFLKRNWEAADTVIALASGLVFIIFAVFLFLCVQGYGTTIRNAENRAQTASDVVSDQVEWMVGSGLAALQLIESKLAQLPAALEPEDKADLDNALKALPAGTRLAIYDAQGLAVANGGSPSLPATIAGTDYFAALSKDTAWLVLPQIKDAATGEPLMLMVIAQGLGTDVFAGVALLAIEGKALQSFWQPQKLGQDSTLSLLRTDGWLVGRYPPTDELVNASQTSPYWGQISTTETGTYTARSQLDGITRVIGYRHLDHLGLIVFATIAQDTIIGALWNSILIVLALLVPIALALLAGSFLTARLLRQSGQTQRTLATALGHNEVLFREIHHRVKNNLQSVASLLQMQPIPREIKANMGQRIAAMSAVHEHIYRSNNFSTVSVKGYLQTLMENIRGGQDTTVRLVESLDDLSVEKDAATPLGLILNEVVANAFKHAFSDGRDGVVTVRLTSRDDGRGELTVEDNGVGFDPEQPVKGIGRRLIGGLTQQLRGESHFETARDGGSLFTLTFPLASPGTAPSASPSP
ncbi:MAG: histidine kinase dimerization/phosphoacceptor domain -containing protein, partial [Devosia sp.]